MAAITKTPGLESICRYLSLTISLFLVVKKRLKIKIFLKFSVKKVAFADIKYPYRVILFSAPYLLSLVRLAQNGVFNHQQQT